MSHAQALPRARGAGVARPHLDRRGALQLGGRAFVVTVLAGALAVGLLVARQPLLAAAVILLLVVVASCTARPDLATLGVLFLFYTDTAAVGVKLHGVPLMLGAMLPLALVVPLAYYLYRGQTAVFTPGFAVLLLLFATEVVSTMFSDYLYEAWPHVQTFAVEGVVLYFLVTNVLRTPQMLRAAIWAIIVAGGLLGALSLFQEVTGTYARPYGGFAQVPVEFFTGHSDKARLAGPLGDPNYYAQILLALVPLALFRLWAERSTALRLLAVACLCTITAGILLTYSRGAGIAFVTIFLIMAFLRYIKPFQIALVVIGVVIALTALPAYTERIATVKSVGGATTESGGDSAADESMRSRMTEMLAAAYVFADHPTIGVGPGVFGHYYGEYAERIGIEVRHEVKFGKRRGEEPLRESHNMLLSIAAEMGLLGLLCFVGVLLATLAELLRARRRWLRTRLDLANLATSLILAIVAYVASGLFLTLAFERYFWLLLAIAGAAGHVLNRVATDEAPMEASGPSAAPRAAPAAPAWRGY